MQRAVFGLIAFLAVAPLSAQTSEIDYESWERLQLISALSGLTVSPEQPCSAESVAASEWAGMQDEIAELHGGPLSPYDGIVFPNYHYVQIEHIVARKEADESGLCLSGTQARTDFATDLLNLTLAPGSLNASKGDKDAHDLDTAETSLLRDSLTEHAKCWLAAQTVRVKAKHRLRVDANEKAALGRALDACSSEHVFRPKLRQGSDWSFHPEFLEMLTGEREIAQCSKPVSDVSRLELAATAVPPYLEEIACTVYADDELGTDPRATQKANQTACIQTLNDGGHRTNCTTIKSYCPNVDPIHRGEPLYASPRDTDNDGVACEDL